MKTCTRCGESKPDEAFYTSKGKPRTACKACYSSANRDYHVNNPEKMWARSIRRKYGVSPAEYYAMLAEQNWVCKICGGAEIGDRKFAIDHCHNIERKQGKIHIRGLLCGVCNRSLAPFESPLAPKIIAYLSRTGFESNSSTAFISAPNSKCV